VLRYVDRSKLADQMLRPLASLLDRIGFIGNCDVNCIIDEDGTPWPLEFTMRCGWPSTNIEMELLNVDPVEFWYGLATGKVPRNHHKLNEVAIGVVLAIPDFPYSHKTAKETVGVPIYGLTPSIAEHWHPAQVMKGDKTDQATAGDYVGICSATGSTVREAQRRVYSRIKRLELPSSPFYRVDIGGRLRKDLPALQAHGYATGLDFS
jgi:phosphoribosylamine-glycine ligase